MTVKYYAILTNQGAARLANATMLGSKLNLTQMAVGDANGVLPTPDPAQTKLINQKRIAPLNLLSVDPNNQSQIIAEQIIPENEGGFWIREIGLYDDEGVLIAVANCPETYKPQLQEGSGRTQTIRMILVVTNTEAITLKIDPSVVLATRKYVDDEVLELRLYVDDQMRNHIAAQDPHTQYAQKHNPTFTGEPKAPTPAAGNNTTRIATTAFVQAAITALINGAPDTLDTLKEIAAAINNDPKFSATINNALSGKQPLDETLTHLSGKDVAGLLAYLHLEETVKQAAGAMQKSANGGDIQNVAAFRNALQLGTAALASMGVGKNQVLSASDFSFFAGGNGYLYIPCLATTDNPVKIMLQWGTIRTRGGENNIYNLPYAFPTAGLWAMGCRAANGYSQSMNVSIENRSQIRIQNWAPAGAVEDCCFFAVGYL
ncbi:phage tail protein [Escherichia coli]|uniref:phage tail protein n=1 Tax=Escherichia coli TaxID=562 RepID=UPI0022703847|nr:phage tail protein [Escherichia coli]MCV5882662.1 phage tail protein [Escherichia coli]MCX9227316.1 phage tail protein [Escherichia coli]MCX9240083.1 phage tail protein [Escherichia coli]MCX9258260.1 phage tail protein [Escherichia coli]MCX9293889.1 phage tail protein [Escherichia coli]